MEAQVFTVRALRFEAPGAGTDEAGVVGVTDAGHGDVDVEVGLSPSDDVSVRLREGVSTTSRAGVDADVGGEDIARRSRRK